MKFEYYYLLIFTSFLLSLLLFILDVKKKRLKFNETKLFAIISVIFLPFLWLCVYLILDISCKSPLVNPFLFLVFPIFAGFVIWGFIHSIKYKIFLGKIISAFDILIFIVAFFSREGPGCIN